MKRVLSDVAQRLAAALRLLACCAGASAAVACSPAPVEVRLAAPAAARELPRPLPSGAYFGDEFADAQRALAAQPAAEPAPTF
jgi:hypothetical protein